MSTSTTPAMLDVVELLREADGWPAGRRGTVVEIVDGTLWLDMTGADHDDDDPRPDIALVEPSAVRVTWRAPA